MPSNVMNRQLFIVEREEWLATEATGREVQYWQNSV